MSVDEPIMRSHLSQATQPSTTLWLGAIVSSRSSHVMSDESCQKRWLLQARILCPGSAPPVVRRASFLVFFGEALQFGVFSGGSEQSPVCYLTLPAVKPYLETFSFQKPCDATVSDCQSENSQRPLFSQLQHVTFSAARIHAYVWASSIVQDAGIELASILQLWGLRCSTYLWLIVVC